MDAPTPARPRAPTAPTLPHHLMHDRQFRLALVGGALVALAVALLLPPVATASSYSPWRLIQLVLLFPVLEEFLFRGLLQGAIARRYPARIGPVTHANLATSGLFALAHLFSHPPPWALATLLPSLIFGHFRDRHQQLLPSILLHVTYNGAYFLPLALP
ncbi:MAG: JDVT-CTERM system glutamic-type intramembrane protease [Gammaproteobacteria bacterium]|nr:JDVT-CTERM system glutamic-type intramembrane protease [Gammaproteobacteria bacterium]